MRRLSPHRFIADVEELYRLYHRAVYLYLLRLSGSQEIAEDLLQETFYHAVRGAVGYRGEASPLTWLCAIARRLFCTHIARTRRERGYRDATPLENLPALTAGPEALVLRWDQQRAIEQALQQLPETQRVALLLRDSDGLSYEEIAEALGISLSNVKVSIHRARVRFRESYRFGSEEGRV